jgi:thioredoxin reductase (NADPH)
MEEVSGEDGLHYARYRNTLTGEVTEFQSAEPFGVFVFAGYAPDTERLHGMVALDAQGYIVTDSGRKTSVDGVYAAGDVCIKPLRQVVTAVGDGALAATELEKYVAAMQRKTGLHPEMPKAEAPVEAPKSNASSALFDENMLNQLNTVFSRMGSSLILQLELDDRPVSNELKNYMEELAKLTDKLTLREAEGKDAPCVRVLKADGSETGLAFHGVPGGHEFTSFVLGLYNAAGPGQPLDGDVKSAIGEIGSKHMQVLVSLSCTMCPELVVAAQKIAAENPHVTAEVYDINHFPHIREKYNVMSVPCLVINDGETVTFGKKNIRQLTELLR